MRRRFERERQGPWREQEHEQDDRDGYGEHPVEFGEEYDDAERRYAARGAYGQGQRGGGEVDPSWRYSNVPRYGQGERGYGGQGGYGGPSGDGGRGYAGQRGYGGPSGQSGRSGHGRQGYDGGYGESGRRGYGGQGGSRRYGSPQSYRDPNYPVYREPSRDRWEAADWPGASGGPGGGNEREHSFRGRGPKGYTRSDDRIREEICECLSDEDIDVSDVEVSVSRGEVTLSGSVADRRTKRDAESIAEDVAGVRDISNQIRVRSESERQGEGNAQASKGTKRNEDEKRAY